jgi:hypothetical protein
MIEGTRIKPLNTPVARFVSTFLTEGLFLNFNSSSSSSITVLYAILAFSKLSNSSFSSNIPIPKPPEREFNCQTYHFSSRF